MQADAVAEGKDVRTVAFGEHIQKGKIVIIEQIKPKNTVNCAQLEQEDPGIWGKILPLQINKMLL